MCIRDSTYSTLDDNKHETKNGVVIWVNRFQMVSLQPTASYELMNDDNKFAYSPTRGMWWEGKSRLTLPDDAVGLVDKVAS